MTTDTTGIQPSSLQAERQDHIRRGLFAGFENIPGAGRVMSIEGTGWTDEQVVLVNLGYGFNPTGESETLSVDPGADPDNRHAFMAIPRDRQHPWAIGTSGIQSAENPDHRIEFGPDGVHITNGTAFFGENREFSVTVQNGKITISAPGQVVNFVCNAVQHNGTNIGDSHTHTDPPGVAGGQTSGPA